jgi:putative endonuclease
VAAVGRVSAAVGRFGEQQAVEYLTAAGWEVLDRNWRAGAAAGGERAGELDLVAWDGARVVFVEVKTRSGALFGGPAEAVTAEKVRRLRRLAARWLAAHPDRRGVPVRFDVVSVRREAGRVRVGHLRGAF